MAVHKAHNKCSTAWNSPELKGVPTAYTLGSHFPRGARESAWETEKARGVSSQEDKSLEQGNYLLVCLFAK